MSRDIPDEISALAEARSTARAERNFGEADRLRAEIEAAGWKVVDIGVRFRLSRQTLPDVVEDSRVRYGSSASVPSRLEETPSSTATLVLRATDWPDDLERALRALGTTAPQGTQVVVVADAPSAAQEEALESIDRPGVEVVWTATRLGQAAALNAGIRRANGATVMLLDASVEPRGDIVTPLVEALADPGIGVAGGFGVSSRDLRKFDSAPAGDVDALEGYILAFRRDDYTERGPLDEHFRFYRNLDLWWSLVLRDEGEETPPRRALAIELPLVRHEQRGWEELPDGERERLSKRNFYRIIDRFGRRYDLLRGPASTRRG